MTTETSRPRCPLCGGTETRVWKASSVGGDLVPEDLAITDSRYGTTLAILECSCGFRFADPRTVPDLVALYEALDDEAYRETAAVRRVQQRTLVEQLLRRRPRTRTLLDVGAANGLLVEEATRAGVQALGVEPSVSLAAEARERGVDVRTGVLPHPELADRRFDAVTLIDVIEHVPDPVALLRLARAHVAPDGCVFVVTPDIASIAARALGRRWWHLRLAHVVYFTRATLTRALEVAGFVPESWWRPGWVFEVGYLTARVGEYVPPVGKLASRHEDSPVMHRSVPLNLFDSLAVVASPRSGYDLTVTHTVTRNDQHKRYELEVDGRLVGIADFVANGSVLVLPHTEIDAARRGHGLGAVLVAGVLDDVRKRGERVVPTCWYVREYMDLHPETADLLAT